LQCSGDLHSIVDCNNNLVTECQGSDACDSNSFTCVDACTAAEVNKRSVGCDYYATSMDVLSHGNCFAAFVANTWTSAAHINVKHMNADLPVGNFIKIPQGNGPGLTYAAYDPVAGLAPGQVAVLFLGGSSGGAPLCPFPSAVTTSSFAGTGIGNSFEILTDVPVVAYQINPYGGGNAAVTAASLLIPSSAWDLDYVAVNVTPQGIAGSPSLNIIAREDGTVATIAPPAGASVAGGGGIPGGSPVSITLNKGQHAQLTQSAELTGSIITSNKPVGVMAGQTCMNMPTSTAFCDHGEQMIPPVHALGNQAVGVMYRARNGAETGTFWKIVGAVDGTQLTWSSQVGGPATINKGQAIDFNTGTPFTVSSQDKDHPFLMFTYMTGSEFIAAGGAGSGDPDFVLMVPPEQYLNEYIFFADPTYPETNLVVTRTRGADAQFHDVTLDCLGTIVNWTPLGGDFEFARVDLDTGNFANVGNCSTGRHEMKSDAPFGLTVWGWGTNRTSTFTANVSYGYPGGMDVKPINDVVLF
jgi:IgGFc binding protein